MPTSGPPETHPAPPTEGRRERNKRLKAEAILAAAEDLFRHHGYTAVTTQQIAEAAQVSNGSLFRFAGTKADLLIRVMESRLRLGREQGLQMARSGADPVEAIIALLHPIAETGMPHPEVVVAYQRELLFAEAPERGAELDSVEAMEAAIREVLTIERPGYDEQTVHFAAFTIYSTIYMDLVRVSVGRASAQDLPRRLRATIRTLLDTLIPAKEGMVSAADPARVPQRSSTGSAPGQRSTVRT
ncbi:TetR/AcrR family transcriptional regulator [Austwickia sp. TVS 96-490-7B]|uniref:TetR/AcrR family transcriptional regulator n=1 Tax=Austwickia sp. TVS 96-490-7B TaxID=2830843 RepID=UPI001C55FF15|nr:TetR/AcrR family transcriptional regulator [Austwickia sp. TVS 96-490-7B]